MRRRTLIRLAVGFAAASSLGAVAEPRPVLVFAAVSLQTALDAIVGRWRAGAHRQATISYAASSTLAKEIANGAPADLFISADLKWMDYLEQRHLIDAASRLNLLGNSLVLIAPANTASSGRITPGFPLAQWLGGGRLAMADPAAVPAGIYGKEALQKLGVWPTVEGRIAAAENVRAALLLVARGEAPLGIVYRTDAASEPAVRVVGTFPADSHAPIVYPMALTKTARPGAAAFAAFLHGPAAGELFAAQGFTLLDRAS